LNIVLTKLDSLLTKPTKTALTPVVNKIIWV
jgi:hypothetical protein